MSDYVKLKDLVGSEFTVGEVYGFQWKMWDNEVKRMLVTDKYEQGYRKVYTINTDKGKFDISSNQLGSMYESCSNKGKSDIIARTFTVKSNGKDGIDIRYYINAKPAERQSAPSWEQQRERFDSKRDTPLDDIPNEDVDLSQIPF
jgi:hypothetical protein